MPQEKNQANEMIITAPKAVAEPPKSEEVAPKQEEVPLTAPQTRTMSQARMSVPSTASSVDTNSQARKTSVESNASSSRGQLVSMRSENVTLPPHFNLQEIPEKRSDRKLGKLYTVAIYDYTSTKPGM